MSAQIGRDAVDGYVWLYDPPIEKSGGPERVATEAPPDGWEPPPFLGFAAPAQPAEPEPEPEMPLSVRLIGGPYDGVRTTLASTPGRIAVAGVTYVRVDDPDTGAFLGGYAHQEA